MMIMWWWWWHAIISLPAGVQRRCLWLRLSCAWSCGHLESWFWPLFLSCPSTWSSSPSPSATSPADTWLWRYAFDREFSILLRFIVAPYIVLLMVEFHNEIHGTSICTMLIFLLGLSSLLILMAVGWYVNAHGCVKYLIEANGSVDYHVLSAALRNVTNSKWWLGRLTKTIYWF